MRCIFLVCLSLTLLVPACDSDNRSTTPKPAPETVVGHFDGTVIYWAYTRTDSAEVDSAVIEFTFEADRSYQYFLPEWNWCNQGYGTFEYDEGRLTLHDFTVWPAMEPAICFVGPLNAIGGEFRAYEAAFGIVLTQKVNELEWRREIRLTPIAPVIVPWPQ